VGAAWTEVPGARNAAEFLTGLRAGRGRAAGTSGNYARLTVDILSIIASLFRESPWTAALAPVVLALPAVTLVNWGLEAAFAGRWSFELTRQLSLNSEATFRVMEVSEEAPA
jgi:hypothetical protein